MVHVPVPLDDRVVSSRTDELASEVDALLDAPEPEGDFRDARQGAMIRLLLLSPPDVVIDSRG